MAHIDVTLSEQGAGEWVSDMDEISVSQGDSVTISSIGDRVHVFFSLALLSIVSPRPPAKVSIDGGHNFSFTFESSAIGAYYIAYGPGDSMPFDFPSDESQVVALIPTFVAPPPPPPPPAPFSGPNTTPQGN
jgi:hypothetical protein